jgi:hypothetical protein
MDGYAVKKEEKSLRIRMAISLSHERYFNLEHAPFFELSLFQGLQGRQLDGLFGCPGCKNFPYFP